MGTQLDSNINGASRLLISLRPKTDVTKIQVSIASLKR